MRDPALTRIKTIARTTLNMCHRLIEIVERGRRFELLSTAWKAGAQPLYQPRSVTYLVAFLRGGFATRNSFSGAPPAILAIPDIKAAPSEVFFRPSRSDPIFRPPPLVKISESELSPSAALLLFAITLISALARD